MGVKNILWYVLFPNALSAALVLVYARNVCRSIIVRPREKKQGRGINYKTRTKQLFVINDSGGHYSPLFYCSMRLIPCRASIERGYTESVKSYTARAFSFSPDFSKDSASQ